MDLRLTSKSVFTKDIKIGLRLRLQLNSGAEVEVGPVVAAVFDTQNDRFNIIHSWLSGTGNNTRFRSVLAVFDIVTAAAVALVSVLGNVACAHSQERSHVRVPVKKQLYSYLG